MTVRVTLIAFFALLLGWAAVRSDSKAIEASLIAFLESIGPNLAEKSNFHSIMRRGAIGVICRTPSIRGGASAWVSWTGAPAWRLTRFCAPLSARRDI